MLSPRSFRTFHVALTKAATPLYQQMSYAQPTYTKTIHLHTVSEVSIHEAVNPHKIFAEPVNLQQLVQKVLFGSIPAIHHPKTLK